MAIRDSSSVSQLALVALVATAYTVPVWAQEREDASRWYTLTVPGTVSGLATSVRLDPAHVTRDRLLVESVRAVHRDRTPGRGAAALAYLNSAAGAASFTVPLPMGPQWWTRALGPSRTLLREIFENADTGFVYTGLMALDGPTRGYVAATPTLTSTLFDHAAVFAAYGGHLRVRNGRVDAPGGTAAVEWWQTLVGEPVDQPERFIRAVLGRESGRLAYFYGLIDALDEPRVRFALGLSAPPAGRPRPEEVFGRFNVLEQRFLPSRDPFTRPASDPTILLTHIAVDRDGRPTGPTWRFLWDVAFRSVELPDRPEQDFSGDTSPADSAFLVRRVFENGSIDPFARLGMLFFAQRVFATASVADAPAMLLALRGVARFPMLCHTIERMGVTSPAVYASAVRRAASLDDIDDRQQSFASQSQFQAAIALIERAVRARRVAPADAAALVESLALVPLDRARGYGMGITRWLQRDLLTRVAAQASPGSTATAEQRLIAGLAGITVPRTSEAPVGPEVEWEGWRYVVDPALARLDRLVAVRATQGGNTLDALLELLDTRTAIADARAPETPASQSERLRRLAMDLRQPRELVAAEDRQPVVRDILSRAAQDVTRIGGTAQAGNVPRRLAQIDVAGSLLTADYLRAAAYAVAIPVADTVLLAEGDVSHLHDFGLAGLSRQQRERAAWALPEIRTGLSAGAKVHGSLLGLDVAFSEIPIRQVAARGVPGGAEWSELDRRVYRFALSFFDSEAASRGMAAVAAAIARGRARIDGLVAASGDLERITKAAGLSPLRRSLVEWSLNHDPQVALTHFSMAEILRLGEDAEAVAAADAWGAPALPFTGCLCLSLGPAVDWSYFGGRNGGMGYLGGRSPDLLLRMSELAATRGLPAAVVADVLPAGLRQVMDLSHPLHVDDWPAIVRQSAILSMRQFEDMVADVTAGHSMVPVSAIVR